MFTHALQICNPTSGPSYNGLDDCAYLLLNRNDLYALLRDGPTGHTR
jgi:hypothetical protein